MSQDKSTTENASSRTITDATYAALKDDIVSGAVAPGRALLTRELIERYGCGISPLREALARLVSEGLLEASSHRGVKVPVPTLEDLNDIYRIRIALECEALTLAMKHGDDHWEASIVAAVHRLMRMPLPDGEASAAAFRDWEARHRSFHISLIAAAPAPRLLRLVGQMMDQTERYRALRLAYFDRSNVEKFVDEHVTLKDAVIARDPRAPSLLADHLEQSRRFVAAYLESFPFGHSEAAS